MPTISPFDLDPAAGLDRFTAYWYATVLDTAYRPDTFNRLPLYALAGATSVTRVLGEGSPFPSGDVSSFPAGRALVTVRGTTTRTELLNQLVGLAPVPVAPWTGQVGAFWAAAAAVFWAAAGPVLADLGATRAAWSGHSYGAAVATLLPELALDAGAAVTDCLCTCGGPRVGTLTFSLAQSYRHLRLTNHGDPVPMLPPSSNPTLDSTLWVLAPPIGSSFWHTGTRCHLFIDGSTAFPPEQSTWATAELALITTGQQLNSWFADHDLAEYARRLRVGIPVSFGSAHPDYVGIETLDQYWGAQPVQPPAATWLDPVYCAAQ